MNPVNTDAADRKEPEGEAAHEAQPLAAEAVRLAGELRLGEALQLLRQAVERRPVPYAVRHLANLELEHERDPARAMETLAPLLSHPGEGRHPYVLGLASSCRSALGDRETALRFLRQAVDAFEKVDRSTARTPAWRACTGVLLRAAGDLGDHREAWKLHQRWSHLHVQSDAWHYAAVAAFNLRRWDEAARAWRRAERGGWLAAGLFADGIDLFKQGLVPPLTLSYRLPVIEMIESLLDEAGAGRLSQDGAARAMAEVPGFALRALGYAFLGPAEEWDERGEVLAVLVAAGGGWGEQLGRNVLNTHRVDPRLKFAAVQGLVRAGIYRPGDEVPIVLDGRLRPIRLWASDLDFEPDPELEQRFEQVMAIQRSGELSGAPEHPEQALRDQARPWVPVVIGYAERLRETGRVEEAHFRLLEAVAAAPDHPLILFALCTLLVDLRELDEASKYLNRLDVSALPPVPQEAVPRLNRLLKAMAKKDLTGVMEAARSLIIDDDPSSS
ncbi:MAG TPA: hypothetical protein VIK93_10325 [Limnochordales bacterium]